MKYVKIKAKTYNEAMMKLRMEYGDDAIPVSHRYIKEGGLLWMHKSARIRDAVHAEKLGADAVIVVGLEGTGFKQAEQLPTMMTTVLAKKQIKIPFISAGGIGEARGFLGALAMGAGVAGNAKDSCLRVAVRGDEDLFER